jgi:hypothetical protein
VPVFARDPHQEAHVVGLKLFRGQIIFERLGSLQIDIIDIALCNELVRGFCMERCGLSSSAGKALKKAGFMAFKWWSETCNSLEIL